GMRLPIGECLGQKRCAMLLLMMQTSGASAVSPALKSRPCNSAWPMLWKYPGTGTREYAVYTPRGSGAGAPSALNSINVQDASIGDGDTTVADFTPGIVCSCASEVSSAFCFTVAVGKNRSGTVTLKARRYFVSKPHGSSINFRKYCVAVTLAVSSAAAMASSITTNEPSSLRALRSSVAPRDVTLIAPRKSVRDARKAGSKPKPKPTSAIIRAAKANTGRCSLAA